MQYQGYLSHLFILCDESSLHQLCTSLHRFPILAESTCIRNRCRQKLPDWKF